MLVFCIERIERRTSKDDLTDVQYHPDFATISISVPLAFDSLIFLLHLITKQSH